MNLLIIGSDSFIAQNFITRYRNEINITPISRTATKNNYDIIIPELHQIPDELFIGKDVVINFAALVHQPNIKNENTYNNVNCYLTLHNANKSKNSGVNLFIQISSIAVYGNVANISIETPTNPQNPYARSKLKADEGLLKLQDKYFKIALIRPPMVYGGGRSPGNMMRLIRLADKGIPLPFKGINNSRDFINVRNLIQYIKIIIEKELDGIHLISDNEPVSTEHILETISKYLGRKIPLIKIPQFALNALKILRPNDYVKLFGTSRIMNNLDCDNKIHRYTIDQGIHEMVDYYITNIKKNS